MSRSKERKIVLLNREVERLKKELDCYKSSNHIAKQALTTIDTRIGRIGYGNEWVWGIIEDAINDMDRVMFVAPEPVTYDEFLEEAPEKPTLVPTMFVKEKSILDEDWMQFAWPNSRI